MASGAARVAERMPVGVMPETTDETLPTDPAAVSGETYKSFNLSVETSFHAVTHPVGRKRRRGGQVLLQRDRGSRVVVDVVEDEFGEQRVYLKL